MFSEIFIIIRSIVLGEYIYIYMCAYTHTHMVNSCLFAIVLVVWGKVVGV